MMSNNVIANRFKSNSFFNKASIPLILEKWEGQGDGEEGKGRREGVRDDLWVCFLCPWEVRERGGWWKERRRKGREGWKGGERELRERGGWWRGRRERQVSAGGLGEGGDAGREGRGDGGVWGWRRRGGRERWNEDITRTLPHVKMQRDE